MLKFIITAAVVAFAVGIIVGVNSKSGSTSRIDQVLSDTTPASSDFPQLDVSYPDRTTNAERIDAEIAVLKLLEASIPERNEEYKALISEIAGLKAFEDILAGKMEGVELYSNGYAISPSNAVISKAG